MNRKLQPSSTDIYSTFKDMLTKAPVALCGMLKSFLWHTLTPKQVRLLNGYFTLALMLRLPFELLLFHTSYTLQIIIAGDMDAEDTKSLLRTVHSFYLPNRVLIVHSPTVSASFLSHHNPSLVGMISHNKQATAYVCENFICSSPVSDPESLKRLLDPTRHLKV